MSTMFRSRRRLIATALICALGFASSVHADTLTLMWDLNDEPEVNGYLVYIGTQSGTYSQTVDVQNTDTYVFSAAAPGQRYYFAVAAYAGSLLSPLSVEVSGISNEYPTLSAVGDQTTPIGGAVSLQLNGSDPRGDALSYSASGLPDGLMVSQALGLISGVAMTPGSYAVTVTVSDGVLSASRSFTWEVIDGNVPPTLAAPGTQTSILGQADVLQLQGADANGDALTYTASGLPGGMQLTASTGQIAGTPTSLGTYAVTVTVSDGSLSASRSFTWTIVEFNTPPTLTQPANQSGTVGQQAVLQLQGADAEGDTLTYTASGLPAGLQLTASTGRIAGTPLAAGTYQVSVSVSDGTAAVGRSFTWTIAPANAAPSLASPGNQSGIVGQPAVLQLQGSDANGDTLTYAAAGLPPGLQINASTGRIAGTPLVAGSFAVTVTASDGKASVQRAFVWSIVTPSSGGADPGEVDEGAESTESLAVARQSTKRSAYTGAAAATRTSPREDPSAARTFTGTTALQRPGSTEPVTESAPLAYTGSSALQRTGSTEPVTESAPVAYTGSSAMARSLVTGSPDGGDTGELSTSSSGETTTAAKVGVYEDVLTRSMADSLAGGDGPEDDGTGAMAAVQPSGAVTAMAGAPAVTIQTPVNGAVISGTDTVIFSGVAHDMQDGDLSSRIVWSSDRDGQLGTGAMFHAELTAGAHVVSATVTDSDGASRSAQVSVSVGAPDP